MYKHHQSLGIPTILTPDTRVNVRFFDGQMIEGVLAKNLVWQQVIEWEYAERLNLHDIKPIARPNARLYFMIGFALVGLILAIGMV